MGLLDFLLGTFATIKIMDMLGSNRSQSIGSDNNAAQFDDGYSDDYVGDGLDGADDYLGDGLDGAGDYDDDPDA